MKDLKNKTNYKYKKVDAVQQAIDFGIDVTLLYETLSLTPTERLEKHDKFLEEIAELRKAGQKRNAKFYSNKRDGSA